MNRTRLMWSLVCFGAAMAFLMVYVQRKEKGRAPSSPPAATAPAGAQSTPASAPAPGAPQPPPPAPSAQPKPAPAQAPPPGPAARVEWKYEGGSESDCPVLGSLTPADGYKFQVALRSLGASIDTVKLADHFVTVEDKRLFQKDPAAYEEACRREPEKYRGHYALLHPVDDGGKVRLPLATTAIQVNFPGGTKPLETELDQLPWFLKKGDPEVLPDGKQQARFTLVIHRDAHFASPGEKPDFQPFLKLTKTYEISRDSYSIAVRLTVENLSSSPLSVGLTQAGPSGVPRESTRDDDRKAAYGRWMAKDQTVQAQLKPRKELDSWPMGQRHGLGFSSEQNPVLWMGEANKYFGSLLHLDPSQLDKDLAAQTQAVTLAGAETPQPESQPSAPKPAAEFFLQPAQETSQSRAFLTGLHVRDLRLPAVQPGNGRTPVEFTLAFDLFAGPKLRQMFQDNSLYRRLNYRGTIEFGGCTSKDLTVGMMWLLVALSKVSFGNYGVAIILLVLLVRLVLHPLTKKGQVSMSRMQKLGPQVQKLKEKYADDKEALNRETMQLYKQAGATPLLGCLPMLLQMPIWIALWTALNITVELRHAAFLPVWIIDLAAPDALFTWSRSLPLVGTQFNLLPILLSIAMFFQSQYTPQMGSVAATPEQEKQQKMMKYFMPVFMLFIFYNMPSGLTLYIMASTFGGVAEQYVIRKHIREREAREAAVETRVEVPGKGLRSHRPRKPRGPFWVKNR